MGHLDLSTETLFDSKGWNDKICSASTKFSVPNILLSILYIDGFNLCVALSVRKILR